MILQEAKIQCISTNLTSSHFTELILFSPDGCACSLPPAATNLQACWSEPFGGPVLKGSCHESRLSIVFLLCLNSTNSLLITVAIFAYSFKTGLLSPWCWQLTDLPLMGTPTGKMSRKNQIKSQVALSWFSGKPWASSSSKPCHASPPPTSRSIFGELAKAWRMPNTEGLRFVPGAPSCGSCWVISATMLQFWPLITIDMYIIWI